MNHLQNTPVDPDGEATRVADQTAASEPVRAAPAHREKSRCPWFLAVTLGALALLVFLRAWQPLDDNSDFWAHAATGRWILAHGQVPHRMLFLWTDRSPWIAHSWGTQVLFALFLRGGEESGARLALLWTCLMGLAIVMPWLWRWRRRAGDTFLLAVFGSMCVWLAAWRFTPRPEMWTLLLLSLLFLLFDTWVARDRATPQAASGSRLMLRCGALFAIFVAWANLHGLVFVGMAFLVAGVIGELAERKIVANPDGRRMDWTPLAWPVAAALGSLCNPYGAGLWGVLLYARGPSIPGTMAIFEFLSPFAAPACDPEILDCIIILAAVGLVAWMLSPRRQFAPLLWCLLATVLVLSARRHLGIFAVTALVVFATSEFSGTRIVNLLRGYGERTGSRISLADDAPWKVLGARLAGVAALFVWLSTAQSQFSGGMALSPGLAKSRCDFLDSHAVPPQLFADYNGSSFLTWRLGETRPLYIHLLNVSDELSRRFQDLEWQHPPGQAELDSGQINTVTLGPVSSIPGDYYPILGIRLANDPRHWAMIYAGSDGFVWVRRTPSTLGLCKQYELHLPPELFEPGQGVGHAPMDASR